MRLLPALLAAAALACSSPAAERRAPPEPAGPPPVPALDVASLDRWFDAELAPHSPAVVAGVVIGDELVWQRAAGARDGAKGPPPDHATAFRIGSITKTLTAIALMRLVEDGTLDLDAPAARHVPELEEHIAGVTLRHLVTHTSGIRTVGDGSATYTAQKGPTEAELLRSLAIPLEFAPGSTDTYSNAGMALAGSIAARAAKKSYRELMAPVLAAVGMRPLWDVPASSRAVGRSPAGVIDPPTWILGAYEPAGGLWASLDDMVGLARFIHGGRHADAILPAARRAQMFTDDPLPGRHGVAWIVADDFVGHTGSTGDFAASIIGSPSRRASVIVLASGGVDGLADCAASVVLAAVVEATHPVSCASFVEEPLTGAPLPPEVVAASMDRLVAFLAAPDEATARAAFSPAFLAELPVAEVIDATKRITASTGRCTAHTGAPPSTAGSVLVRCGEVSLTVEYQLEASPPHRFDGARVTGRE